MNFPHKKPKRMHWQPKVFALIGLALVSSCERRSKVATAGHEQTNRTALHAGDLDENGRLVIFAEGSSYGYLETDYALIFLNSGTGDSPKCRYDLTSRESGYESFETLDRLVDRLEHIPAPRIVDLYVTCAGPPWLNLPKNDIDRFFQRMAAAGVKLRHERPGGLSNVICTCP